MLADIEIYKPDTLGKPPLSRARNWHTALGDPFELSTMPSWAGSSWYFLRYMDPNNKEIFADRRKIDYWKEVDLYVGGKEHATGHLIYARFFTKFLYDLGYVGFREPFKQLVNQGMIQSFSRFVYRIRGTNKFVSYGLKDNYDTIPLRVDMQLAKKYILDLARFKVWRPDLADATFILEEGKYICGRALEKMSKSKYNTIDPYPIIKKYGADGLRLYLLFLGPITESKPWTMEGIEGIVRFMKKVWYLFHQKAGKWHTVTGNPTLKEKKVLHKAIKRVRDGIERFAFNTSVSGLMVCVNELLKLQCANQKILQEFTSLLTPFAPHMAEFFWQQFGRENSVMRSNFPMYDPHFLAEKTVLYAITINGKLRAKVSCPTNTSKSILKEKALAHPKIEKLTKGKKIVKTIFVLGKLLNIVI